MWKVKHVLALLACDSAEGGSGRRTKGSPRHTDAHRVIEMWRKQAVLSGPLSLLSRKALVDDPRFVQVDQITLVCDNLNTHKMSSLYKNSPAAEAQRLVKKLEIVHTSKHGSWLNVAESELNVLTRQSLAGHIGKQQTFQDNAQAFAKH